MFIIVDEVFVEDMLDEDGEVDDDGDVLDGYCELWLDDGVVDDELDDEL